MDIAYVEGNLIDSAEGPLVHGCNALGKFAKGVAGAIRKAHPPAYDAYIQTFNSGGLVLGSIVWSHDGDRVIGNAITQPTYGNTGQHVSYAAIRSVMKEIDEAALSGIPGTIYARGFKRFAMPLIGSSLGGGEWAEIERIISETLQHARPVVYVLPGNKPSASELSRPK
jgi:O-acetyl-ADP-ribose deacetylase (regulator of RNase III)